jgi:hypothetical protein
MRWENSAQVQQRIAHGAGRPFGFVMCFVLRRRSQLRKEVSSVRPQLKDIAVILFDSVFPVVINAIGERCGANNA